MDGKFIGKVIDESIATISMLLFAVGLIGFAVGGVVMYIGMKFFVGECQ